MCAIARHPLVVSPEMTAIEAISLLNARQIARSSSLDLSPLDKLHLQAEASCILIVDRDRLVGILTARDIVRLSAERMDLTDLTIDRVMTATVFTISAAELTDVAAALNLLAWHQIGYLPVVDDLQHVIGLLTAVGLQQQLTAALTARVIELESAHAELLESRTRDFDASQQFSPNCF